MRLPCGGIPYLIIALWNDFRCLALNPSTSIFPPTLARSGGKGLSFSGLPIPRLRFLNAISGSPFYKKYVFIQYSRTNLAYALKDKNILNS